QRLNADGTLVTVVGKGTAGYSGDGGRATFAELDGPRALALSPAGDLFIADLNNAVIRKYNISSGIITTYAGTGRVGYSGDGGPAVLARLGSVQALALDASGNLYIADTQYDDDDNASESRIRRVTPAGIITTVAGAGPVGFAGDGGPATSARITSSLGLAVDSRGNLYISDTHNSRIRMVTPGGIISTYAGQSKTRNLGVEGVPATEVFLNQPAAIALDPAGNLFIPESAGELVRRVDAQTRIISTVAGTSNPFDGTPGASAPLNRPTSVATDRLGNIYIADVGHFRVRRIDARTGLISTIAGDGKLAGAEGATVNSLGTTLTLSIDPLDRLLIADRYQSAVFSVDLRTGKMSLLVDLSDYDSEPTGVVGDAAGNVYISDWNSDQVYRYSPEGKLFVAAGIGYHGVAAFSGDGGPADKADLNGPQGLALDNQGRLLICDTDNHRVRRVDLSNIIETFAGDGIDNSDYDTFAATLASLRSPVALAMDSDGWIYIADSAANQIRVVTTEGIIYTAGGGSGKGFGGDGGPAILSLFDTPLGVAASGIDIYVSDSFNYRIRHLYYLSVDNHPEVDPPRLSFRATRSGAEPSAQLLVVRSSYIGLNLDYTVDDSDGPWLYACTGTAGTDCYHGSTPDLVGVAVDPTDLAEGRYSATLVVRSAGASDLRIPVDFTIDPPNVVTSVTLSPETSQFTASQNTSSVQQVAVSTAGKTALAWSVRRQTDSPWLKFSANSGTTPATVDVSADSTGLRPGTYSALSYFVVDGGSTTLFIATLTVTDARATMQIDRDSLLFEAVEGTTTVPPQPVNIYNSGGAPLNWQLTIPPVDDQRRAVNWVRASAARDTTQVGGAPSRVNISVDPSGLRAGTYSVPVALTAAGAAGAPQVIGVRLRILPAGTPARPVFNNTALLFVGAPNARLEDQTVELSSTGGTLSFASSVSTDLGGKWLNVSPATGLVLSSAQKSTLKFQIIPTALSPGVYTGSVKFSFSDGSVRQVNVTMILRPGAGTADTKSRSAGCEPSRQVLVVPTMSDNFALNVGWPIPVQAQVFDDCGSPSTTSTVNVTFDNGDPVLVLRNLSGGQYAGTWTPVSAASGAVSVAMLALRPGMFKAEWKSTGRISKETSPLPILASGGVLNAATRVNTSLLAPGGRLALQGANFPESAADATVLIGGVSAKVVSSTANEMQVVAPSPLDGITQT
ncbi:MAG TPA: SMP-30/gluconolactonase/LRE family protein, partial [Bryobacteraceae bacterium]|nr:SMP-30/gluconolactonase/LRE family protein [Bryobacteraceae bacterium]